MVGASSVPPGDGKWIELEFAGLFGTGLDRLETVISLNYTLNLRVNFKQPVEDERLFRPIR